MRNQKSLPIVVAVGLQVLFGLGAIVFGLPLLTGSEI
jgi:hypothetical protein